MPLFILHSSPLLLTDRHTYCSFVLDNWKSVYEINRCITSAEIFEIYHGAARRNTEHRFTAATLGSVTTLLQCPTKEDNVGAGAPWAWRDHCPLPQSNPTQGGVFWDIVFLRCCSKGSRKPYSGQVRMHHAAKSPSLNNHFTLLLNKISLDSYSVSPDICKQPNTIGC